MSDLREQEQLKNLNSNPYEVRIFADVHIYPDNYKMMAQLLSKLKEEGYGTIYMEMTSPNDSIEAANVEDLIKKFKHRQTVLNLFANEEINKELVESKLDSLNGYYLPEASITQIVEDIKKDIAFDKEREKWLEAVILFLNKVKELNLKIVCIDVRDVSKSTHGKRNEFMVDKIVRGLGAHKTNAIVVAGLQHVVDMFGVNLAADGTYMGTIYDKGIVRLLHKKKINIRSAFFFYSQADSGPSIEKALGNINISIKKIIPSKVNWKAIDDNWLAEKLSEKATGNRSETLLGKNTYQVLLPPVKGELDSEGLANIKKYVMELGGEIICNNSRSSIEVAIKLPGSIDDNRKRLVAMGMMVQNVPVQNKEELAELRGQFPAISVEEGESQQTKCHIIVYPCFGHNYSALFNKLKEKIQAYYLLATNSNSSTEANQVQQQEASQAKAIATVARHSSNPIITPTKTAPVSGVNKEVAKERMAPEYK